MISRTVTAGKHANDQLISDYVEGRVMTFCVLPFIFLNIYG